MYFKKDEMKIYGKGMIDASNKKIHVGNLGDHRVAMCAFIIAILTKAKTNIKILKLFIHLHLLFENNEKLRSKV